MNIFIASMNNDLVMLESDLKDINLQNNNNDNALIIACQNGHKEAVEFLLSHCAKIESANIEWIKHNANTEIAKMILTAIAADDLLSGNMDPKFDAKYNDLFCDRILFALNKDHNLDAYEVFKKYCNENPIEFTSANIEEIDSLKESFNDNGDSWRYRVF